MIPLQHHFRSHIARSSRLDVVVILVDLQDLLCDSEISEVEVALVIEDEILRFQVSMDYLLLVAGIKGNGNASSVELSALRLERLLFQ